MKKFAVTRYGAIIPLKSEKGINYFWEEGSDQPESYIYYLDARSHKHPEWCDLYIPEHELNNKFWLMVCNSQKEAEIAQRAIKWYAKQLVKDITGDIDE